ncbi:MAG: hypothetical protein AAB066_04635 [Candidatus Margulisiibacteriota bacterium]
MGATHSASIDHDMSQPNSWLVFWTLIVSGALLILCSWVFWGVYEGLRGEIVLENEKSAGNYYELQGLRTTETTALTEYRWLDKEKNKAQIPIEAAKNDVVRHYQAR